MNCLPVSGPDDAMKKLPSSVLPINGLRRDNNGDLTADALRTIIDGLKSRGIDPTDAKVRNTIQTDLASLICSVNLQYGVLLREVFRLTKAKEPVSEEIIKATKDKNITMQDAINVSRHLDGIQASESMIEGWQNTESTPKRNTYAQQLKEEFQVLDGGSYLDIQKRMVNVTEQKNAMAYNYLGLYGFLNLIAIGLLVYIAAGPTRG
jgi:hypothetical protein